MILLIIGIVLFALSIITGSISSYLKNKYTKVMEQQNTLLWMVLKESNDISKNLIKINSKKAGEQLDEVQEETSSS